MHKVSSGSHKSSEMPNNLHSKWTVYNQQPTKKKLMIFTEIEGKVLVGEEEELQGWLLTDQFPKCPSVQHWGTYCRTKLSLSGRFEWCKWKRVLKRKKKTPKLTTDKRVKKWEITEITEIRGGGGKRTPGGGQIFPAAHGKPVLEQISWRTDACREPMPEQVAKRNHCELATISSSSSLCCLGWGESSLEWRNEFNC